MAESSGFNPCFDGSDARVACMRHCRKGGKVSILVLMEVKRECLPDQSIGTLVRVSILVLMEVKRE